VCLWGGEAKLVEEKYIQKNNTNEREKSKVAEQIPPKSDIVFQNTFLSKKEILCEQKRVCVLFISSF